MCVCVQKLTVCVQKLTVCVCVQKLTVAGGSQWCTVLAEHVRHNDRSILDSCDAALAMFEGELLPCETFQEFLDVVGTWGGGLRG